MGAVHDEPTTAARSLRLLSCNILAGGSVHSYRDYVTQSLKHMLPGRAKQANLDSLARLIGDFDVVGLQEADAGSLRSGFLNQTGYLAWHAIFTLYSIAGNCTSAFARDTVHAIIILLLNPEYIVCSITQTSRDSMRMFGTPLWSNEMYMVFKSPFHY